MVTIVNRNSTFDIRHLNLSAMLDEYKHHYESTLLRCFGDNGAVYDFEGTGFKYQHNPPPVTPIAGTLESFSLNDQGVPAFKISDLNMDITDMVPAARTASSADDLKLFEQLMHGRDTYQGIGELYSSYVNTFGGKDTLIAGHGKDVMFGGEGADTFVYKNIHDAQMQYYDELPDFSARDHDRIDLSAIDANGKAAGNQAFDFIGTDALDHQAGELHVFYDKRHTFLAGDINGDGEDDFQIALDGHLTLTRHSLEL